MAKGKSKFQQESEAANPEAQATSQLPALFSTSGNVPDLSKFKRLNLPQMVKPGDVPVEGIIFAEIISIHDSPVSTVKGKLLWLRTAEGREFTFPATGVIRSALAPGMKSDDKGLHSALEAHVGKKFVCKRLPNKLNKQYGKDQFMFDVFLSDK